MLARKLEESERPIIDAWARHYWKTSYSVPWRLIVEPWVVEDNGELLAFLNTFPSQSLIKFVTYTMANPEIASTRKHVALEFLFKSLENEFIQQGGEFIFTVTGSEHLEKALKETVKFKEGERGVLLLKRLGGRKAWRQQ